jgi:hypothetical protein
VAPVLSCSKPTASGGTRLIQSGLGRPKRHPSMSQERGWCRSLMGVRALSMLTRLICQSDIRYLQEVNASSRSLNSCQLFQEPFQTISNSRSDVPFLALIHLWF